VAFEQIYYVERNELAKTVPTLANGANGKRGVEEMLAKIAQLTDNTGASHAHRAVNYLAMRYSAIYEKAIEAYQNDFCRHAPVLNEQRSKHR
jgi:hypothetical protein